MDNTALILIVSMNILLVIILGIFGYFIYRLVRSQNEKAAPTKDFHPEIKERIKSLAPAKAKRADLFCPNHSEEPGEASCAICDHLFCSSCIKPFKAMHLCKEHLPLLMKNDWVEVLTLKTSTEDPEAGVELYSEKKKAFLEDQIPSYIETHYKINVDHDYVETYLVLFSMSADVQKLKDKIKRPEFPLA